MKNFLTLAFCSLMVFFCTTTHMSAQTKEKQNKIFEATYHQSKTRVQSQQYTFVAEMVYENKTRERLNGDSNSISVNKTKVEGTLTTLTSENKTFNLNGIIEDYNVSFDDDTQQISIQFNVKSLGQPLEVLVDVKPNGNVFLVLKSRGKPTTCYVGELEKL